MRRARPPEIDTPTSGCRKVPGEFVEALSPAALKGEGAEVPPVSVVEVQRVVRNDDATATAATITLATITGVAWMAAP